MNSDSINIDNNNNFELNQINIKEEEKYKDEKSLLNILTNKDLYNDKKTKILLNNEYEFLIKLFNNIDENIFINLYKYFNKINIPILKILIVGYIEFDIDKEINEKIILDIIYKMIYINFNKDIFYYVYKKLSKQYRRHYLAKSIDSIKKIDKLFNVWKLLYNISNNTLNKDLYFSSSFIFFPSNLKDEESKFIEITIDDKNKIKNLIFSINFIPSPILNVNKINEKFSFLRLYDSNDNKIELKFNDLNSEQKDLDISFSQIFKIKFVFSEKEQYIFINKSIKICKNLDFNFISVTKIDILNNFIGDVSSVVFKKEYSVFADYAEGFVPILEPLKMKIYREGPNESVKIKTNAFAMFLMNDKNNDEKINKVFPYQYCGTFFSIKINYEKNENKENFYKKEIDLSQIKYIEGLNCFIPLFKIIKYVLNNLESIACNNLKEEKLLIEINKYIDKFLIWIQDILKIILNMICLSERNYENFKKIVIPLIGSLAEISHSLNTLNFSEYISKNLKTFLFHDDIFSCLYLIILISSFPNNIKKMYRKIVGINKTLDNLLLSCNSFIIDIKKNNIKNLNWYFTILIVVSEFIFIYYNNSEKVPLKLINQIKNCSVKDENEKEENEENLKKKEAMRILSDVIYNFYTNKNNDNMENIDKKFINENNYYLQCIIYMITAFLNSKILLNTNNIIYNDESYYHKFLNFIENYFKQKDKINITDDYAQMIINLNCFSEEKVFLQKLFPFLKDDIFISPNELIMEELIDYHSQYHHLMKKLFVFNKLWSNQKNFFNNSLDKMKKSKLKYKNINYYTRNFQRPIIYPVLDYKYRYPDFSHYKIKDDFYNIEEDKDDYNFDLDCPEFNEFIEKYDNEIFKIIEKNGKINICEVCLVKQTHHVKGNLFVFYNDDKIIIYFYSYSFRLQNNEEEILCCNKGIEEENNSTNNKIKGENQLCYGSIFKCPKKDANKKIKIELDDIRLVLSRIYFYRNSALEIFTKTKSYYFNFVSEKKRHSLSITFMFPCQKSYFPININGNMIGYMKINKKIIDKNKFTDIINENNKFIEFITSQTSKGELCEMCLFDIIMLINLISNRSFSDLYQYPIFPLLYFYDKQSKIITRDFKEHIGFQENSEYSKLRKSLILKSYQETINEKNEKNYYDNEKDKNYENELYFFNTHYSNSIYTSNYLIRLFPYSFSAIELQGNGFDNPNRLFFGIEDTFYNISAQKSDLRELIPEFFYLPEMFMNINNINFHKRSNNELVDDVIMPTDLQSKYKTKTNSFEFNEEIIDDFNIITIENNNNNNNINKNNKKENFKKCFTLIEDMKGRLENNVKDIAFWINLIFGLNQKYSPKNQQYFRLESCINLNDKYHQYLKNEITMNSVEFGLIPLQTIFDNKILTNLQKHKNTYDQIELNSSDKSFYNIFTKIIGKETKKIIEIFNYIYKTDDDGDNTGKKQNEKTNQKIIKEKINEKYFNNEYNDYWDEHNNISFNINNYNNIGKLEIYKNNILIKELIDHNDRIIDFFYNRRLNMYATTSYDGFACIYIYPYKLFCMIKHPKNLYFDKIYLSANPFPTIITYEEKERIFTTYSLSGMIIKKVKIESSNEDKQNKFEIKPIFNVFGGVFKDKIKISFNLDKKIKNEYYNIPFFDIEYKEIINK